MADRGIVEATRKRCVEFQEGAREAAYNALYYVEHGMAGAAIQMQREARYLADEAQMRLSRLIGVA